MNHTLTHTIEQFKAAMLAHGITPPDTVEADGLRHRFDTEGRKGNKSGWYTLHTDGTPAGNFGCWRTMPGGANWCSKEASTMTEAEKQAHRGRVADMQRQREADTIEAQAQAKAHSAQTWAGASPCTDGAHPYLLRKGIQAHGAKVQGTGDAARLLVPLYVGTELVSLQFIDAQGGKRFQTGGQVKGASFTIGQVSADGPLLVCEGFATGASLHQCTGLPVAVAFNAGNLLAVAQAMHRQWPQARLTVAADDDLPTPTKPQSTGITKGTEAAQAVGALLAVPDFGNNRPEGASDFNDLHQLAGAGAGAVVRCIGRAKAVGKPAKQSQHHAGGRFEVSGDGVFFIGKDKEGEEKSPLWLCSPLHVEAQTRNNGSEAWGRLLTWRDNDQVRHTWAMPMDLVQGDGLDMRRELARRGLQLSTNKAARDLLATYIQTWNTEGLARCVDRLGWHGAVYVTPTGAIGQSTDRVVFQNAHALEPTLSVAGTWQEWRQGVAALATGNTRLVFALSVAFAGPLCALAGEDSGGFQLRGPSSIGKTAALAVAASLWGKPSAFVRLWRATANGLEGLAMLHNDGVLILDELSQCEPKAAGEAAYMLANGQGKTRATKHGAARQAASWRLLFLSSGEKTLPELLAAAGIKANAGQEVRMADIEADAGAGMGVFEALHQFTDPARFAEGLKAATDRHHGAAGMEWLKQVAADRAELIENLRPSIDGVVSLLVAKDAPGQLQRVARRFALVAIAGEIATQYDLTGWAKGEATQAAKTCFNAWRAAFGSDGDKEGRTALEQVKGFFETHGASRFENMDTEAEQRTPQRAGFYREGNEGREYLVLPEVFKNEVCKGLNAKAVTKALTDAGWLKPGEGGRLAKKERLPGMGPTRCYVFTVAMWGDASCD